MYVVRPQAIRSTPRQLATDLGWQTRRYPSTSIHLRPFDYRRDFFMANANPIHVKNYPEEFTDVYSFLGLNKYGQRKAMEGAGIPVPRVAAGHSEAAALTGDKFVVRPLRHSGGHGYRVTQEKLDFIPGTEYISELYAKRREYRVIFVFGKPLIYLRKKPNEGVDHTAPWGHVNSFFQTIQDVAGCRLASTDCVSRLASTSVVGCAHIVAADILYNKDAAQPYVVLELNACPSLSLDNNRAKVVEAIRGRI